METSALIIPLALSTGLAAVCLAIFIRGMAEEYRATKRGSQLRPGLRAANGWSGSLGTFLAILAIILGAWFCAGLFGPIRWIGLMTANLLLQPLALLFLVVGCYQTWQGLRGRVTHGFRVIARERISEEEYRLMVAHRVRTGLVGVAFAVGLSSACLWPAL
jgi:hypothetical protein